MTREEEIKIKVSAKDAASGVFARVGQSLNDLKRQTGSRGPIKDVFEILRGGGAVAGLTFGAMALRDMANEAARLRDEFSAGKIATGELVEGLIKGIPVIGRIREAGLAIRELITGEQAEIRKITEEAEQINRIIDARNSIIKAEKTAHDANLKTIREIRREIELISASPLGKAIAGSQAAAGASITSRTAAIDKRISDANEASDKLQKELRAKSQAARNAIPPSLGVDLTTDVRPSRAQIEQREQDIKIAQTAAKLAANAEVAEQDRLTKQIADLNQKRAAVIGVIQEKALTEQAQIAKEHHDQMMKDHADRMKGETAEYIRQLKAQTAAVLEAKRQQAINDAEAGEAAFIFAQSQIQGGEQVAPVFRRRVREAGPVSRTASLETSRFIAGNLGGSDPQQQIAIAAKRQTQLAEKADARDTKIDRTLGDMLIELRNQRLGIGGGGLSTF